MDKIIGLKELRENIDRYAKKIEKGESFLVVRRSKPLFKVGPVDEEDNWETIVDFTKYRKGGMPAEDVLRRLRKLRNG
jgi:antitoxin (DNA-binding transcriptional repressor) of toxin-antitoxin stability system